MKVIKNEEEKEESSQQGIQWTSQEGQRSLPDCLRAMKVVGGALQSKTIGTGLNASDVVICECSKVSPETIQPRPTQDLVKHVKRTGGTQAAHSQKKGSFRGSNRRRTRR